MTPRMQPPPRTRRSRQRTNVYVNGFNLYYGCLKGTSFRWLDLHKLFTLLLPGNTIWKGRRGPESASEAEPCDPRRRGLHSTDPARPARCQSVSGQLGGLQREDHKAQQVVRTELRPPSRAAS